MSKGGKDITYLNIYLNDQKYLIYLFFEPNKKGFFRRSIKERAPERYRCMETGNCEISVATRNMCRHCRFQRCIKAGMSAQSKS